MIVFCAWCNARLDKPTGAVNRARKSGLYLYCDRICGGLGRRKNKSKAQKVEEKRVYDIEYRAKNSALLKAKKAAYFQRTYDPVTAAEHRKARMPKHVEYCRRPTYRAYKREYDRQYLAKKRYGEFWESALLARQIRDEALARMSDYEIRQENGTLNKIIQRRREHERLDRKEPESGPLGNLDRREGRQDGGESRRRCGIPGAGNPPHSEYPASDRASVEAPGRCGADPVRRAVGAHANAGAAS